MEMMVSGSTDAANAMGATGIVVNVYFPMIWMSFEHGRNIEEELATVEGVKDISDSSKGTIPNRDFWTKIKPSGTGLNRSTSLRRSLCSIGSGSMPHP